MSANKLQVPITTLAGSRFSVFVKLSLRYGIERKYLKKYLLSALVSLVCTILGWFDRIVFAFKKKPQNAKAPIFVIGHWRSGTTFLHNMLCLDPEASYTTTYQTVFPNNLFAFQWLLKPIMKYMMPNERPVDKVKLGADFPQEEEFALNNEYEFSFYNWWYFPKDTLKIADRYLFNKTSTPAEISKFKKNYQRFVTRCLMNVRGERFISKNPPNTLRTKEILEMYPDAKFIYINRNPYEVIMSTYKFYLSILPGTQLQFLSDEELLDQILEIYIGMIRQFEKDKTSLSDKQLLEIKYEDMVVDPKSTLNRVYTDFIQDDFSRLEKPLEMKISSSKHKLKDYKFEDSFIRKVNSRLANLIEDQGYKRLS